MSSPLLPREEKKVATPLTPASGTLGKSSKLTEQATTADPYLVKFYPKDLQPESAPPVSPVSVEASPGYSAPADKAEISSVARYPQIAHLGGSDSAPRGKPIAHLGGSDSAPRGKRQRTSGEAIAHLGGSCFKLLPGKQPFLASEIDRPVLVVSIVLLYMYKRFGVLSSFRLSDFLTHQHDWTLLGTDVGGGL